MMMMNLRQDSHQKLALYKSFTGSYLHLALLPRCRTASFRSHYTACINFYNDENVKMASSLQINEYNYR